MPTTVKDMLSAARAAVPEITPTDAADLVANADALVVDVRDGTEVAASGKVKGALAISRGLLEFRADPE
ncbi:MAG: rhodanese-like protein, partial [Rhodopila sp.]|nr:rhodanese-like protein [Rhodopila sp.]